MSTNVRYSRLWDQNSQTSTMVALSNSMYFGPSAGLETVVAVRNAIQASVDGGADAIMLTPGALTANADLFAGRGTPAIVLSAGYTTTWRSRAQHGGGGRATDHALFASVEQAVALGVDAIHVYAFLGYNDAEREVREVQRVGKVIERAHSFGLPVLAEPLFRGDGVTSGDENSVEHVGLAARILSEIGVDIVKVEYTGSPETFASVVASSHAPVIMMGGALSSSYDEFLRSVESAMNSGARGLAVGRNVYTQPDVTAAVRAVTGRVRQTAHRVKGN